MLARAFHDARARGRLWRASWARPRSTRTAASSCGAACAAARSSARRALRRGWEWGRAGGRRLAWRMRQERAA